MNVDRQGDVLSLLHYDPYVDTSRKQSCNAIFIATRLTTERVRRKGVVWVKGGARVFLPRFVTCHY